MQQEKNFIQSELDKKQQIIENYLILIAINYWIIIEIIKMLLI